MGHDDKHGLALEALEYALNVAVGEEWNIGEASITDGDTRAHVGLIAVRKMRAAIAVLSAPSAELAQDGDAELCQHLEGEHHAILAQSIDSPHNACEFKETCLWLKRLALSLPAFYAPIKDDQAEPLISNETIKGAASSALPQLDASKLLDAAEAALRAYEYGNSDPTLAKQTADAIRKFKRDAPASATLPTEVREVLHRSRIYVETCNIQRASEKTTQLIAQIDRLLGKAEGRDA